MHCTSVAEDQVRYERDLEVYQKAQADAEQSAGDANSRGLPASEVSEHTHELLYPSWLPADWVTTRHRG